MAIITDNNIGDLIVTSSETLQILNISKQRLSQLVKSKKLSPIKKGVFLKEQVLERKAWLEQIGTYPSKKGE